MPIAPLLSIIIVAYKSRDEIDACLASIPRMLLGGSVEIVVVDNSLDEGTRLVVRERFPWVKYLTPEKNLGFGRANNLGFAEIDPTSEFVLFLNPDTVCNETALAHCVSRLRADPTIGLISPKLVLADGSMDAACRRSIPSLWDGFCRATGLAAIFPRTALFSGYNLTHLPEDGTYDVGAINGAFMLGRRVVFEAIAEKTTAESLELRAESDAAQLPSRRRVEDESLKFKDDPAGGLKAESLKLKAEQGSSVAESEADDLGLTASSVPLSAAREASPVESSELSVEGEAAQLPLRPRQRVEDVSLRLKGMAADELKADSLELKDYGLPLTASSARPTRVFDDSFFMYGDDLDLCIRVAKAGYRIVYDGSVSITHLKGVSVAKDYEAMSQAIFDANRNIYLKHFNPRGSRIVRWKYMLAFGAWKGVARLRAKLHGHRKVRPL